MRNGGLNAGSNPAMDSHTIEVGGGGVELLLVASRYRNQDKLRPDGPLGSYVDFTYLFLYSRTTENPAVIKSVTLVFISTS